MSYNSELQNNNDELRNILNAINDLPDASGADETVLADIYDEIRNKTGLSDELTIDQAIIDIAAIPTVARDVPDYVQTEAERVAGVVKALQNENTISFIAMSDIHCGEDVTSPLHAAQATSIIKSLIPIDFTAVLGDIAVGSLADTYDIHTSYLMNSVRVLSVADPDLRLDGNHDTNIYNISCVLSPSELHRYTSRFNNKDAIPPTDRGYFHYDLEDKKLRVICLNSADLKDIVPTEDPSYTDGRTTGTQDGHHISAEQFGWLVSVLDMTGKTDWKIIVLSHHPLHWYGRMPKVQSILDAYISGTSGSITEDNTTVTFDFSGKNAAKLVGTFHGHTHNFIHGKVGENDIIRFGTPNACYGRNNEYGSTSYDDEFRRKYGEVTEAADGTLTRVLWNKTLNGAKDTSFIVYTIDFENEVIYATCYGAGYDRFLSYSGATYYSITNNLNAAISTNNSAVNVKDGDSYTATLTVIDGYSIGTITVTMGGVDITSDCLTENKIQIANVTGDIVITASVIGYVNWVYNGKDTSGNIYNGTGYKEGYRLSTSSGDETAVTGQTVTGFIPIPLGAIIRVKGMDLTNTNSTYCFYDSNFAKIGSGYCNNDFGAEDENGIRTYTTNTSGVYFRMSGIFGANPIITVNEEIVEIENDDPIYKNLVLTSIDTDGSIYNGTGYKADYRLNSSGTETQSTGSICCGYIPVTKGDIVRVYGCRSNIPGASSNYFNTFNSSFAKTGTIGMHAIGTWEEYKGKYLWTVNTAELSNAFVYFRTSMASCAPEDFVVTINEPIT